ncbi:MAG: Ig-like domain-containing protein [Bacteroidales bacterium]|nr:Ig-like domain-containing protein [Bacteroidales bacterium]
MKTGRTVELIALGIFLTLLTPCCSRIQGLKSVRMSQRELIISEGATAKLSAQVLPEGSSQELVWSSLDDEIASVDQDGLVHAKVGGRTYIMASNGPVTGGCMVRVIAHVSGVKLSQNEAVVERDGMFQLIATVLPEAAYNDTVKWKSTDENIAVVGNGIVTGLNVGKADIVVITDEGGFTDTCHVEVISSIQKITLSQNELQLNTGGTAQLTATISPADATYPEIVWTSSDDEVATVDQSGNITARKRGKCTVTATAAVGGASSSCEVTVYSPVTGVIIDKHELELYVGDRAVMTAKVLPEDANNNRVTWTSSKTTVAKIVSATGVLTAVSAGVAEITVKTTEGGFTDVCTVTVIQGTQPVTGVELDKASLRLRVGGTYELYAKVSPVDAANKKVTWTTSASTVASVDSNGKVTAKDAGSCTITATTADGGFVSKCEVKVVGFDTNIGELDETGYEWEN